MIFNAHLNYLYWTMRMKLKTKVIELHEIAHPFNQLIINIQTLTTLAFVPYPCLVKVDLLQHCIYQLTTCRNHFITEKAFRISKWSLWGRELSYSTPEQSARDPLPQELSHLKK